MKKNDVFAYFKNDPQKRQRISLAVLYIDKSIQTKHNMIVD